MISRITTDPKVRNNLSAILQYQLPEFIREDHEVYAAFLQAYFQYLEETGNVADFQHRFRDNMDVDLADENFINAFYDELCGTFKKDPLVAKDRIIKHIKDFYLAKGAEQSFQFIFTVLYNEGVEIAYPRVFMQKASAGVYKAENVIYTTADNLGRIFFDNATLISSVTGLTSGSSAIVDTIDPLVQNEDNLYRIKLSSYDQAFEIGEDIKITINDNVIYETILPSINGVTITNAGTNYTVGDEIVFTNNIAVPSDPQYLNGNYVRAVIDQVSKGGYTNFYRDDDATHTIGASYPTGTNYAVGDLIYADPIPNSYGHSFSAEVAAVDGGGAITSIRVFDSGYDYPIKTTATVVSENGVGADITLDGDIGQVQSISIVNSGYNYPESDTTVAITGGDGTFAGTVDFSAIYQQPKKYLSIDNHLSSTSKLQDSWYYQQFSYTVNTNVKPGEYYDMLKSNVHPVGAQMFPIWKVEDLKDMSIMVASGYSSVTTTITQFGNTDDAADGINIGILDTVTDLGVNNEEQIVLKLHNEVACSQGNTFWDLDQTKFWTSFNFTLADFVDVKFSDFLYPNCYIYYSLDEQPDTDLTIL